MKKVLLGLLVIVIVGVLGSYYYVGMLAETDVKEGVSEINVALQEQAKQGTDVKLSIKNYSRGLFSSSADLMVSMSVNVPRTTGRPAMRMPSLSYPIKLSIKHGPFIFSQQTLGVAYATASVEVPDKMKGMAKMFLNDGSTMPRLLMNWHLNFNESNKLVITVPKFKMVARKNRGSIEWKGLESQFNFTDKGKNINGYTLVKGIDFVSQKGNVSLGQLRVDYRMHYSPYRIWLGDASFNLPSLDVTSHDKTIIALTNLMMKSDAKVTNELLNMGMMTSLTKCVVMGATYGPGEFDMVFTGFHAKTFADLQAKMQAINNPAYPPSQKQQMFMALMPDLVKLISNGAAIEIRKMNMKLPEGQILANAKLTVPKDIQVKDPLQFVSQLNIVAHLSLPKSILKLMLVKQAENKIEEKQQALKIEQHIKGAAQANPVPPNTDEENNTADASQNTNTTGSETTADSSGMNQIDVDNTVLTAQQVTMLAEQQGMKQLAKLIQHQLLREEGNNYVIDLSFSKGQLIVNGKPTSPDILKQ
jgi:uncharacterized protein YdgA (DUF945 family)